MATEFPSCFSGVCACVHAFACARMSEITLLHEEKFCFSSAKWMFLDPQAHAVSVCVCVFNSAYFCFYVNACA